MTTMLFLQGLITQKKQMLFQAGVICIHIPLWPELALKKIWPLVNDDPMLCKCLPDIKKDISREVEREFFWTVMRTVKGDYTLALLKDLTSQRLAVPLRTGPSLDALISDTMADLLLQEPYRPSRCPSFP